MNAISPDQQHWRERLSDYLDNRLDEAERAEVESAIQNEGEAKPDGLRAHLDQLSFQRDSLKQLHARDARQRLDSGFADRVLDASVIRAIDEGVGHDHPLMRMANQSGSDLPVALANENPRAYNRRLLTVIVGIAASIALAVFVANRSSNSGDSVNEQTLSLAQNSKADPEPSSSPQPMVQPSPRSLEPAVEALAVSENTSESFSEPEDLVAEMPMKPIQPNVDSVLDSTVSIGNDVAANKLAAIMVLEIKQTESGRIVGAVRRAMKNAGIRRGNEKSLTAEIAETASQTVGLGEDELVSMVYLQASAKNIDQFYVNLFDDRDGVASVSLAIATEAPVLELVNAVDVIDATSVKSGAGSATLLNGETAPLTDLDFAKVSRESMRGMALSSGPDFAAQLIIVIR
ncbi:hypothetical protein LF1_49500 [Rubripirellula obstinata]|uniref:Putative zinc-finger domain-containing protein n=1 Tax=Rubripirellula obstinata TaxID=406547 RepID=A0A5B1CPB2_9BACT|nr:zf-HC2 domain-containing protein [Rubripirellula obstinata]KAA1262386.1 hypothetical protein LF1_49500 [Rubripirellula obstinata]